MNRSTGSHGPPGPGDQPRLDSHPTTEGQWLLKGGTALNLLHLDVPRMPVDIDLNFIGAVDREGMVSTRPKGEVDASILHSNPSVQRRIQAQPALRWKALNVRRHLEGGS